MAKDKNAHKEEAELELPPPEEDDIPEVELDKSIKDGEEPGMEEGEKVLAEKAEEEEEEKKEGEPEALQVAVVKETYDKHNWDSKVARFLAYVVDGGILCS